MMPKTRLLSNLDITQLSRTHGHLSSLMYTKKGHINSENNKMSQKCLIKHPLKYFFFLSFSKYREPQTYNFTDALPNHSFDNCHLQSSFPSSVPPHPQPPLKNQRRGRGMIDYITAVFVQRKS